MLTEGLTTEASELEALAGAPSQPVRKAAKERLAWLGKTFGSKEEMELIRVRLGEVRALEDQQTLAEIVDSREPRAVREAALERLEDEEVITRLALNEYEPLAAMAVSRLGDERIKVQIACEFRYGEPELRREVRKAAVAALRSQKAIFEVATSAEREAARTAAMMRLEDQAYISACLPDAPLPAVRKLIARSTDPAVLAKLARGGDDATHRWAMDRLAELGDAGQPIRILG